MREVAVTLGSLLLTGIIIGNAFYQKKQFYPSVVYITRSNPSMAVMYVQAFVFVILTGKLMRKVFFGQLRAAEFEHLMERSWYAVTETCLAFTVFRDDFSPKFVALFTVLLFLKAFHWLADERVDYMERSPLISWLFHVRVVSLLTVLGALDLCFVSHAYYSTITKGASVQLVFGFEYAILFAIVMNIAIKYALHVADLQSDNPWENKAVYLLYTELIMGLCKVILYLTFVIIMVRVYTLPLFAFRPMYLTMRAFRKAFNDVILSRRAIHNMNTLYPDATAEEVANADNVCIICREEMVTASKKLPCNHIFHTSCLRSWFQRQQTCPTCRLNVLRVTPLQAPPINPLLPPNNNAPAPDQVNQPVNNNQPPFMWPGFPPFPPQMQVPQPQQPPNPNDPPTGDGQGQQNTQLPFVLPPFPFMPFTIPPPMPPVDFSRLSDTELREMEGRQRQAVEARIRCLRNIQNLLDAAVIQMQQYSSIVATLPPEPLQPPASVETTTTQQTTTNAQSSTSAVDATASSSTANAHPSTSTSTSQSPQVSTCSLTSPDVATVTDESTDDEVRRRRIERFGATTAGNVNNIDGNVNNIDGNDSA